MQVARGTEGGDAPGSPGVRSENTGLYLSDEQRREAGCSAGRMQRDLHHGLLEPQDRRGLDPLFQARVMATEDVAGAVYLLCLPEAKWINGAIIPCDGGESIT